MKTVKTKSTLDLSRELSRQSVGLSKFNNGKEYSLTIFKRLKLSIKHGLSTDFGKFTNISVVMVIGVTITFR